MRRSTFLFTLFGIVLYLIGAIKLGVDQVLVTSLPATNPTPSAAWIDQKIDALRPDHQLIIEALTVPSVYQALTDDQRVYLAREYFLIGNADNALTILLPLCQPEVRNWEAVRLLADHYHFTKQFQPEFEFLAAQTDLNSQPDLYARSLYLTAVYDPEDLSVKFGIPEESDDSPATQILLTALIDDSSISDISISAQLLRANQIDLSATLLSELYAKPEASGRAGPLLAYILALRGDAERSNEILEQVMSDKDALAIPGDTVFIATAYELNGDNTQAMAALRSTWEKDKLDPNIAIPYARLLASGQPISALEIYLSLIANEPSERSLSALISFTIDHPAYIDPYGVAAYKTLTLVQPRTSASDLTLAKFSVATNDPETALKFLENIQTPEAIWLKANANLLIGDRSAAAEYLIELMEQYPPSSFAAAARRTYNSEQFDTIK